MKKSLIALSVIAGMAGVAQAENTTTLYGSIGYSVAVNGKNTNVDEKGNIIGKTGKTIDNVFKSVKDTVWDLDRSTAKFGIKGTEDINSGLQAFYKFEFGISDNGINDTKQAHLGLTGDFGTITLGKQDTIYKQAVTYNDNFNAGVFMSGRYDGADTLGKVVSYVSPDMGGFKLAGAVQLDGNNPNEKGVDIWELGAFYDANGVFVGVAYDWMSTDAVNSGTSDERMGLSGGYKNDVFKAGVGYEHYASTSNYYNVGGEYYMGQNTLRAGVGYLDPDGKDNNVLETALGYQYNLSKRTYTWVEGQYLNYENKNIDDGYQVVVGIRHDF